MYNQYNTAKLESHLILANQELQKVSDWVNELVTE